MSDWIDQLLFYDELTEDARAQLGAGLQNGGDSTIAVAFDEWKQLRAVLRADLGSKVLDRKSLIHFAMWRSGRGADLEPSELADVEAMLPHYEEAIADSPALKAIVDQIAEEQRDFAENWSLQTGQRQPTPITRVVSIQRRRAENPVAEFAWRAAAVIVVVASSVALYLGANVQSRTVHVATAQNEVKSVKLDDGTLVRLVDGAELEYLRATDDEPFSRTVSITGRALVRVTPGEQRFVVETPSAVTTVWGTTFGLDSDESFTEVVLAEGRVSVTSRRDSQHPVVLEAGEMTRVVGSREPTAPVRVNLTDALSYTKLFVFRNESTYMIATKLSEHFDVPITVHPELAQETVTGAFEREWSLGYILETVARTLDGRVQGSQEEGYGLVPLEQRTP